MEQTEELTRFYRDYIQWVKDGAPHHPNFSRDSGLCECAISYGTTHLKSVRLFKELRQQLKNARLDASYPFNINGSDYSDEVREMSMHNNELRLRWVVDHAKLWGEK